MAELPSELVETFVRFGAAVTEERFARRQMFHDVLRQASLRFMIIEIRNVHEPLRLLDEGGSNLRMRMAEAVDRDASAEIEIAFAAHVPHVAAFTAREREIKAGVSRDDVFIEQLLDRLELVVHERRRCRNNLFHRGCEYH